MGDAAARGTPGADETREAPETFRPVAWLRGAVAGAIAVWIAVFLLLVAFEGAPDRAFLGVAFFIAFFTIIGLIYANTAIVVTDFGVVVRGVTSFRLVPFTEILRVDVQPGLLQTTYAVLARRGPVSFSSLIGGHERLVNLIVERSRLARI